MSIIESKFAVGHDIGGLEASIATLIAAGYAPAGENITNVGGVLTMRMDKTDDAVIVVDGDGAIPVRSGTYYVTKAGGAAALTLAAPTADQVGTKITLISGSAKAHVLTATGLIDDGVTGGAKNKATGAAYVGASITLVATPALHWAVVANNVYTVSA